jgi:hypothetical protein
MMGVIWLKWAKNEAVREWLERIGLGKTGVEPRNVDIALWGNVFCSKINYGRPRAGLLSIGCRDMDGYN